MNNLTSSRYNLLVVSIAVEQWAVRVPKKRGEGTRQWLLQEGLLDRHLRIRSENGDLLFPVLNPMNGRERAIFEEIEEPEPLSRHELIGGIAILQKRDLEEAQKVLSSRPSLHTVLFPTSAVEGPYRVRRFEVLAGEVTTCTEYTEYGHQYIIDLGLAYFSGRLSGERQRVLACMGEGERVLDMFAGVGPFAITVAERASLVMAGDINPDAVRLMIENLRNNRCTNVIPILANAAHLRNLIPWSFDRIIMNLPLGGMRFLDTAFSLCRSGGWIHYYTLQSTEGEALSYLEDRPVTRVKERFVRSYSPEQWHAVYDIQVR